MLSSLSRSSRRLFTDKTKPIFSQLGSDKFTDTVLKQNVASEVYDAWHESIQTGKHLTKAQKQEVANGLYDWASKKGAVQFSHVFYPVRGGEYSALKQDAFVDIDFSTREMKTGISGSLLFTGETDGSSFPNGGLRATHRAAAYVGWDRKSDPWVYGNVLYIPTTFTSYYGDALDEKTPLLRSLNSLNTEGKRLMANLGLGDVKEISAYNGWEQEFFIIDRDIYNQRPDLVQTGRCLLGALSPLNQQTSQCYFARTNPRVKAFQAEVQEAAWKLGLPLTVLHNEVAPAQHETSPIFDRVNKASDTNVFFMDLMHDISVKHNLKVLFHEKPFAGINGSGKHCNWNVSADSINLNKPGETEHEQIAFVATTSCLAYALKNHGDLFRLGVASAGNDHRLGAQEAPPAIFSLYCGTHMEEHCQNIINGGDLLGYGSETIMRSVGSTYVHDLNATIEDRNRTASFPFCGNRYEFRGVGAAMNPSFAMTMVHTALTAGFENLSQKIESGLSVRDAIAEQLKESQEAIFCGNGYSQEWAEEAARRGLHNLKTTPEALPYFKSEANVKLFEKYGIFSPSETEARYEVMADNYNTAIEIESNVLQDMCNQGVLPAISASTNALAGNRVNKLKELHNQLDDAVDELQSKTNSAESINDWGTSVKPQLLAVRKIADAAERLIPKHLQPFPRYDDILYDHQSEAPKLS
jgi:glutamine synthetase